MMQALERVSGRREVGAGVRILGAGLVSLTLSVLVPLLLVASHLRVSGISVAVVAAWTIVIYAGLHLSWLVVHGRPRWLSMTFWLYVYVWLGLAPTAQLMVNEYPWPGSYDQDDALRALILIWVGLVSYDLAYHVSLRPAISSLPQLSDERRPGVLAVSWQRLIVLSLLTVVLAVSAIYAMGGVLVLFLPRADRLAQALQVGNQGLAEGYLLISVLRVPPFVVLLFLALYWRNRSRVISRTRRLVLLILIGFLGTLNIIVNNPIGSPRFWVGTILLSFLFVIPRWLGARSTVVWTLGLVFGLVVVFPFADIFRDTLEFDADAIVGAPLASQLTENGDYSSFQQLMNVVHYVDRNGPALGHQLATSVLVFVPRRFWESKSVHTGEVVALDRDYRFTNLEMPLWGEGYVDWGYLGAAVYLFVWGLITRWFERREMEIVRDEMIGLAMLGVVAAFQLFLLRGSLMNALAFAYPLLGLLVLPWLRPGRLVRSGMNRLLSARSNGLGATPRPT